MSNSDQMEIRPPSAEVVVEETAEKVQEQGGGGEEVVFVELPAPAGWKKKFIPKSNETPRKNEIVFISPSGEEMRNKKQLDQYLKSHPGGPPSSEFDWGTGDTPRRSARISERRKAWEVVEDEPPKKKGKRSSLKKASAEKKNASDEKEEVPEETAPLEEKKATADAEMKDADDKTNKAEVDITEPSVDGLQTKDSTEKCDNPEEDVNEKTKVNDTKPLDDADHHSNETEKIEKETKEHKDDDKEQQEEKEEKVGQKIDENETAAASIEREDNSGEDKLVEEEEVHGKIECSAPSSGYDGGISTDIGNQDKYDAKAVEAPTEVGVVDDLQSGADHPEGAIAKDGKTEDEEATGDRPVNSDEVLTQHKSSAIEC